MFPTWRFISTQPTTHASHFFSSLFCYFFIISFQLRFDPSQAFTRVAKWAKNRPEFWCFVRCDLIYIQTSSNPFPCVFNFSSNSEVRKMREKSSFFHPLCDHHCCFLCFVPSIGPFAFLFLAVSHSPRTFFSHSLFFPTKWEKKIKNKIRFVHQMGLN